MIVVMPAGHTSPHFGAAAAAAARGRSARLAGRVRRRISSTDIMPYVEKHYRVLTDRAAPRDRRPLDGRRPDAQHRASPTWTSSATSASSAPASSASFGGGRQERHRASGPRLGRAAPGGARQRRPEEGPEAVWFSTGADDGLLTDHARHRRAAEEARLRRPSSRKAPAAIPGSTGATTSTSSRRSCSSKAVAV